MRTINILLTTLIISSSSLSAQNWVSLATDPSGDGFFPSRPDAKEFFYYYDLSTDSLWFRMDVHGSVATGNWGLNILLDTDQDPSTGQTWPGPSSFNFDIGITVWVTGSIGNYSGTVGVSDANSMMMGNFKALHANNITMIVDTVSNSYIIGLPRAHADAADAKFDLVASVGISAEVNDDIPNSGALNIDESLLSMDNLASKKIQVSVYPNPASDIIHIQSDLMNEGHNYSYGIYDMSGRLRLRGQVDKNSNTIDISSLNKGAYLIQLDGSQISGSTRLMVN